MMNGDECCLMILVCIAYTTLINGKNHGDDITAPGTAKFILHLQKECLYKKKWQAGVDFICGEKVLSSSHDRMR